jgi:hypothetical protein
MTEIIVDGCHESLAMPNEHLLKGLQMGQTFLKRRPASRHESATLSGERKGQIRRRSHQECRAAQ